MVYPPADAKGRVAEANAELLALENAPQDQALAEKLRARVNDYESREMPSAQRRFLMRELQRLIPGMKFETQGAEDLVAQFLEANPSPAPPDSLRATALPDVWQIASPGKMRSRFSPRQTCARGWMRSSAAQLCHRVCALQQFRRAKTR